MGWLTCFLKLFTGTIERPSPGDWIQENFVQIWATKKLTLGYS